MSVLAVELTCSGCGAGVAATEEGRCAHCRMLDRGDDRLLTHDSRGWLDGYERVWATRLAVDPGGRRNRSYLASYLARVEKRIPCGCGCGMTAADLPKQAEPEPRPVRLPRARTAAPPASLKSLDSLLADLAGELEA